MFRRKAKLAQGMPEQVEIISPVQVAAMGLHPGEPDQDGESLWLAIALDCAERPDIGAFVAAGVARDFDVTTRWGIGEYDAVTYALLDVDVPELALHFCVALEVTAYKRSLAAAVETGNVMLLDSRDVIKLQTREPTRALADTRSIVLPASNTEPIVAALQQHFDLPLVSASAQAIRFEGRVPAEVALILKSAVPAGAVAVFETDGGAVLGLEVAELAPPPTGIGMKNPAQGAWAVASCDDGQYLAVLRVEAPSGELVASWALAGLPEPFVRAGAAGPHLVWVLPSLQLPRDAELRSKFLAGRGWPVWVSNTESLRHLRWHLDESGSDR